MVGDASSRSLWGGICTCLHVQDGQVGLTHRVLETLRGCVLQQAHMLSLAVGVQQYFYDEKTTNFLTAEIKQLGFTHVICVGVPRLVYCRTTV